MLLTAYARSPFRDFECYLRIVIGLDEDDFQLILKQYNANSITYVLPRAIYSIKDISEVAYTMAILKGHYKLDIMNLAWKQNVFWPVLD